jgi:hypothetical protein
VAVLRLPPPAAAAAESRWEEAAAAEPGSKGLIVNGRPNKAYW